MNPSCSLSETLNQWQVVIATKVSNEAEIFGITLEATVIAMVYNINLHFVKLFLIINFFSHFLFLARMLMLLRLVTAPSHLYNLAV